MWGGIRRNQLPHCHRGAARLPGNEGKVARSGAGAGLKPNHSFVGTSEENLSSLFEKMVRSSVLLLSRMLTRCLGGFHLNI